MKTPDAYLSKWLLIVIFLVNANSVFGFYEPNQQRWLNRDPIREKGGINVYGFVGNNPVIKIDSLGLQLADPNAAWAFSPPGDSSGISDAKALGFMVGSVGAEALAATGVGLAADYALAAFGLGGAFAETPEGQAEFNEAEQGLTQMGKGIVCNSKVVAHAPIEITSHEQLALRSGTLLQAPLAGTPGELVQGAEAFTYSMQGQNIFVTGSMNFNTTVSENTVQVVTFYLRGKQ
ncbi:MAG: RHS repeat-associated core domain-containing protein [Verrucomicrobiota bacterium]